MPNYKTKESNNRLLDKSKRVKFLINKINKNFKCKLRIKMTKTIIKLIKLIKMRKKVKRTIR